MKEKQKIIIFEGHDMVGKTEIANALSKRLNIPVYKNKKESSRWQDKLICLTYGMSELVQLLEQTGYSLILDRFHASEWVYSREFNRLSHDSVVADYDTRLAKMNCVIIHLWKNTDKFQNDDQDIVKVSQYESLRNKYSEFLKLTKCKVIDLCTDDEDLSSQIEFILDTLQKIGAL